MKILAENRRAAFDFEVLEKFQAGLVLLGQEVKSIKSGHASLRASYVVFRGTNLFLVGCQVPPYQPKNAPDYSPTRDRPLLLTHREIEKLRGKISQKGLTLVPLKLYTNDGKIKLEFALARILKKIDKREALRQRDIDREMRRDGGDQL